MTKKFLVGLVFCLIFFVMPGMSQADFDEWTWMSGSNIKGAVSVHGTKGVPAANNYPGARYQSISWTGNSGGLWLFGGQGPDASGSYGGLNDLWRYDISSGMWTWMSGLKYKNQSGVYGTKGVPDINNYPGTRDSSISWTDNDGNLWLFGGRGYDGSGGYGNLNDLWRYDISSGMWTWMSGSNTKGAVSVYGTKGVSDTANIPAALNYSISWADNSGHLWLFGGTYYDSNNTARLLNVLWRYDISSGMWTWMSGSKNMNQPGVYGTKGVPAVSNIPGARNSSITWMDNDGNLLLFGGGGYDTGNITGHLSDLWRYDIGTGMWTWLSGPDTRIQPGIYGTRGVPDISNIPGARAGSVAGKDARGNLWLFGGIGYDSVGSAGYLNDLWRYDISTGEWTWINGSNIKEQPAVYGTKGVPAAGNIPGPRNRSISWSDANGNLWLFGGSGYDTNHSSGYLSDLWRYEVPLECENECDDGVFCNGREICLTGVCIAGSLPCQADSVCDEGNDQCVECMADDDCSDPGMPYCCETLECVECIEGSDCDEGYECLAHACLEKHVSWLPDTGQEKCYDNTHEISCPQQGENFYGQDAQYAEPRSFTDLGNGIVRDNVTGLEWQQVTALEDYVWQTAFNYCSSLRLGGYSDWRLPTIQEYVTLLDAGRYYPSIDTVFSAWSESYWSSTTVTNDPYSDRGWVVNFYTGIVHSTYRVFPCYVRAVRGTQLPASSLIDNGDGTVIDTSTRLMWQQSTAPGTYSWQQALDYCEDLSLAGYSDWRVPDKNELQSIIDYTRYNPAINPTFFPGTSGTYFASTSSESSPEYAWRADFNNGDVGGNLKTDSFHVRAVRSLDFRCMDDSDCDDAVFCNGAETCAGGVCAAGTLCGVDTPVCDETNDTCVECLADGDCDGSLCVETVCVDCRNNADCPEDGSFCNGEETCSDGVCGSAGNPCAGATPVCDENRDVCFECLSNSDCSQGSECIEGACVSLIDTDLDGFVDSQDNCPATCNPLQKDADGDSIGDVCDTAPGCGGCGQTACEAQGQCDSDYDGIADGVDNCPLKCNAQQKDADGDGIGDVCDTAPGCGGCGQTACEVVCTL